MENELTGAEKIRWEIGQILFTYLQMSADGKAIEANPATWKIAEYIEACYTPNYVLLSQEELPAAEEVAKKYENIPGMVFGHYVKSNVISAMKEYADYQNKHLLKIILEKDLMICGIEEGSEEWQQEASDWKWRCGKLADALAELVELKNMKETEGKTEDYLQRQPKAWEAAKQLVESYKNITDAKE